MMTKIVFAAACCLTLLAGCEKERQFGDASVRVHVTYTDFNSPNPLDRDYAEKKVYIKLCGENSYLFEGTTDTHGVVVFELLTEGADYTIYTEYTEAGIPYKGELNFTAGINREDELNLTANESLFNGFRITFIDGQGGIIPNVNACVYGSQVLADSANCNLSVFSGSTSQYGHIQQLNITPMTYYLHVVDTLSGIPVDVSASFSVQSTGVTKKLVQLLP